MLLLQAHPNHAKLNIIVMVGGSMVQYLGDNHDQDLTVSELDWHNTATELQGANHGLCPNATLAFMCINDVGDCTVSTRWRFWTSAPTTPLVALQLNPLLLLS